MKNPNKIFSSAFNSQIEGDHLKAENLYRKLLKSNPEWEAKKTITFNLGLVSMSLNKYNEAIKYFNISNSLESTDENEWNKCLCYLNLKDWDNALKLFPSRYGNSRQPGTAVKFPKFPIHQINNAKESKNKNLLVLNEQGLGDEILFSTQLLKLDKIVNKALVQVSTDTIDLLNKIYKFKNIELVCFDSIPIEDVEKYDMYIGLGDVFISLYEIGESLSIDNGYIHPYTDKAGVCWSSNKKSPNASKRSIKSSVFKTIDLELVSLQYGKNCGKELGLEDYIPKNCLESWERMDGLDVVVTVDTLMAHIAGLKGIPTILLHDKHLDWRWKYRDSEDDRYSMFYPLVEIVDINDDINSIIKDIIG